MSTGPERRDAIRRLYRDMQEARPGGDAGRYLLEHLAEHGPEEVDVQRAARYALMREED